MSELPTGTLTLLFTDIDGSTQLLQQLGERYTGVLADFRHVLRGAFALHHGHEVDTQGDAFFVVFARASDAVAAAVDVQRALFAHAWPHGVTVRVRIGLHTGEPTLTPEGYVGLDVHHAARIMSAAHGGQILLSPATCQLVEQHLPEGTCVQDLGPHRLKDLQRPDHLFQVSLEGLPTDFLPLKTLDASTHNLPIQPTPFIGREKEVAAVTQWLWQPDVRLLTLTGAGGIGKTRLALQVAAELVEQFADGVFLVPLAPVSDAELVVPTVLQTLSLKEAGGHSPLAFLKIALKDKQILLLLDNFEQVIEAAVQVAELLATCPRLKIIVTSRVVLHLQAEHEFTVPPLSLPNPKRLPSLLALSRYEAVALFIQCAQAVKPDFTVTNANAPAVAAICARLDGLPLAIELAAARLALLTPMALLARLEHRLPLLTRGARDLPLRQQTLRDTIAWSYDLLQAGEQQLFRRLAVFVGGFTLEAVQEVCFPHATGASSLAQTEEGAALEQLAQLLDKSLVQTQQGGSGEPRFTMLETIREYASEQLVASREEAAMQEWHAHYFLRLAEEVEPHLSSPEWDSWLERLSQEDANLRAALAWSKANEDGAEIGLRLAGALYYYWFLLGSLREGRMWLEGMLERTSSSDRSAARGKALLSAGLLAWEEGDFEAASSRAEEALSIVREAQDYRLIGRAESLLGFVRFSQGNSAAARTLLEESRTLFKDVGNVWSEAFTLYYLGILANCSSDPAAARAYYEESLRLFQEQRDVPAAALVLSALEAMVSTQGDQELARSLHQQLQQLMQQARNRGAVGMNLINFGDIWLHRLGDEQQAKVHYREGLSLWQDLQRVGNELSTVKGLAGLAEVAAAEEQAERAGRLFGAASRLPPATSSSLEEMHTRIATARAHLDAATFEVGWAAGQTMTEEQAVTLALQDT